ncbi:glycosyltransferase [Nonomuraea sp. NPDC049758]|uniref:glycosyltransferase family 2 protein n=1 Tax=Nonomuraea sp. NPDC049758 TaxID=3154360 RepID=UPI0034154D0A
MKKPSIGLVIPARNAARWIGQALSSVAAQTLPVAQVIVVDNGSQDDTADMARRWRSLLPLSVVSIDHALTPGQARNVGIETLETELVASLDADDYWLPHHVETMNRHRRDDRHLVTTGWLAWNEAAAGNWRGLVPQVPTKDQLAILALANFAGPFTLHSRTQFDQVAGYSPDLGIGEDWDLWMRMLESGATIVSTGTISAVKRLHQHSLGHSMHWEARERPPLERALLRLPSGAARRAAALGMLLRAGAEALARDAQPVHPAAEHAHVNQALSESAWARDLGLTPDAEVSIRYAHPDLGTCLVFAPPERPAVIVAVTEERGRPEISALLVRTMQDVGWRFEPIFLNERIWPFLAARYPNEVRATASGLHAKLYERLIAPGLLREQPSLMPGTPIRLIPSVDVSFSQQWFSDSGVLVRRQTGEVFPLDRAGCLLWKRLESDGDVRDPLQGLPQPHPADDATVKLMGELIRRGFVNSEENVVACVN